MAPRSPSVRTTGETRPAASPSQYSRRCLVVAPFAGTFRLGDAPLGATLPPGSPVGQVVSRREEQAVTMPHGGTIIEWLVEDGDPVSPGQPLVRLHPEAVPA